MTMQAHELKLCAQCGQRVLGEGKPVFYIVRVTVAALDMQAVRSTLGLEVHFGAAGSQTAAALANIMSPDPHIAKEASNPALTTELHICLNCYTGRAPESVAWLVERENERQQAEEKAVHDDE